MITKISVHGPRVFNDRYRYKTDIWTPACLCPLPGLADIGLRQVDAPDKRQGAVKTGEFRTATDARSSAPSLRLERLHALRLALGVGLDLLHPLLGLAQ